MAQDISSYSNTIAELQNPIIADCLATIRNPSKQLRTSCNPSPQDYTLMHHMRMDIFHADTASSTRD